MATFVRFLQAAFPACFLESQQRPESDAPVRFEVEDEVNFQTNRDVEGNNVAIWCIGRVVRVYPDHTYDIAYDDMIEGIEKIQSRVDEYHMRVWYSAYGGHNETAPVCHTLSMRPRNTSSQHNFTTHSQSTLSIHPHNTSSQHILSTHSQRTRQ